MPEFEGVHGFHDFNQAAVYGGSREEAAAERRRRKFRLRIDPPVHALRRDGPPPPASPTPPPCSLGRASASTTASGPSSAPATSTAPPQPYAPPGAAISSRVHPTVFTYNAVAASMVPVVRHPYGPDDHCKEDRSEVERGNEPTRTRLANLGDHDEYPTFLTPTGTSGYLSFPNWISHLRNPHRTATDRQDKWFCGPNGMINLQLDLPHSCSPDEEMSLLVLHPSVVTLGVAPTSRITWLPSTSKSGNHIMKQGQKGTPAIEAIELSH